ncbi:MAG: divergent polysaccharide deacetylase family protein [Acidobacteriia bacterium]|nr:divergent polysaccharide deacetylase family protein [Terriglobia bacterium]
MANSKLQRSDSASPARPGIPAPARATLLRRLTLAFLLVSTTIMLEGCSWFAPKSPRLNDAERRRIALRIREAIEQAGGKQVWVKVPPSAPFPPSKADVATEVVVTSAEFPAILAALERQAKASDLEVKARMSVSSKVGRKADTRLSQKGVPAGRWLLREVPEIRRAAIIIDDLGQDPEAAKKLLALRYPITFSVLPHLAHSTSTAEEAHRAGREVMLHLPMEPDSAARPGPGEIRVGMRPAEVARIIDEDLGSVPHVVGANNHMGSRATTDARLMAAVIQALADRRLFFVDSRTTPASVALDVARRQGLPTFYRSVFLDDTETVPYTLGQLREFRRVIEEHGVALAIGHPYSSTLAALAHFLPELERDDIQLLPASQLVRLPEVARLSPPRAAPH